MCSRPRRGKPSAAESGSRPDAVTGASGATAPARATVPPPSRSSADSSSGHTHDTPWPLAPTGRHDAYPTVRSRTRAERRQGVVSRSALATEARRDGEGISEPVTALSASGVSSLNAFRTAWSRSSLVARTLLGAPHVERGLRERVFSDPISHAGALIIRRRADLRETGIALGPVLKRISANAVSKRFGQPDLGGVLRVHQCLQRGLVGRQGEHCAVVADHQVAIEF
jgi:hypothetical protein